MTKPPGLSLGIMIPVQVVRISKTQDIFEEEGDWSCYNVQTSGSQTWLQTWDRPKNLLMPATHPRHFGITGAGHDLGIRILKNLLSASNVQQNLGTTRTTSFPCPPPNSFLQIPWNAKRCPCQKHPKTLFDPLQELSQPLPHNLPPNEPWMNFLKYLTTQAVQVNFFPKCIDLVHL